MDPNRISAENQRVAACEMALGLSAQWLKPGEKAGDQAVCFVLPSGRRIQFAGNLTKRECALIQLWLGQDRNKENLGAGWAGWWREMIQENREKPLPLGMEAESWEVCVPVYLELEVPFSSGTEDWKELVEEYFASPRIEWIQIGDSRWLILIPWESVRDEGTDRDGELESLFQTVEGLASALMGEMGQTVRFMVHPPLSHPSECWPAWNSLREGMEWLCWLHPQRTGSATWKFAWETLLSRLDAKERENFLARFTGLPFLKEEETRKTISALFHYDFNLSETARSLYIHRNTLLYRLDRIKQETGLDVRRFDDALLVQTLLVLLGGSKR